MNGVGNKFLEVMYTGAQYNKGSIRAGTVLQLVSNKSNKFSSDDLRLIKIARRKNLLFKILLSTNSGDTIKEGLKL